MKNQGKRSTKPTVIGVGQVGLAIEREPLAHRSGVVLDAVPKHKATGSGPASRGSRRTLHAQTRELPHREELFEHDRSDEQLAQDPCSGQVSVVVS